MCILCPVYILTYIKLYFCFSIPSFVVYTNIMLKDKKYKKISAVHWDGIWRRQNWNGMVMYTAQEFKKYFETKCVYVHCIRHHIHRKLKVAHIYMHSNLIYILIFYELDLYCISYHLCMQINTQTWIMQKQIFCNTLYRLHFCKNSIHRQYKCFLKSN